jgi:hypothetical protein
MIVQNINWHIKLSVLRRLFIVIVDFYLQKEKVFDHQSFVHEVIVSQTYKELKHFALTFADTVDLKL